MKFNLSFSKFDNYEISITVRNKNKARATQADACEVLSEIRALLAMEASDAMEGGFSNIGSRALNAANDIYSALDAVGYYDDVKDL